MSERHAGACAGPASTAATPGPVAAILVTGLAPAARQRAIGSLIACKPESQRWIVVSAGLVNHRANTDVMPVDVEFAALPPGCLCCTGLTPFRVGLTRLLRRLSDWAPTLLLIDAGSESHAASIRTQLRKPDFARLLRLEKVVAAVDARMVGSAPQGLRQALGSLCAAADLVICDTSGAVDSGDACARFRTEFGIAAPFLGAADPACAVQLGLAAGCAGA